MIRIHADMAEVLLQALLKVRYVDGLDANSLRLANMTYRGDDQHGRQLCSKGVSDAALGANLDNLIDGLDQLITKDLGSPKGEFKDAPLIDAIVAILCNSYAQSYLSPSVLKSLRRAVLLPDELAGLTARLQRKELSCAHCSHTFTSREMATIHVGEGNAVSVTCIRCNPPHFRSCAKCAPGVVALSRKERTILESDVKCITCQDAAAKPAEVVGQQMDADAVVDALGPAPVGAPGRRPEDVFRQIIAQHRGRQRPAHWVARPLEAAGAGHIDIGVPRPVGAPIRFGDIQDNENQGF